MQVYLHLEPKTKLFCVNIRMNSGAVTRRETVEPAGLIRQALIFGLILIFYCLLFYCNITYYQINGCIKSIFMHPFIRV